MCCSRWRCCIATRRTGGPRSGNGCRRARVIATLLWLLASVAFSIYVANFNSYNATYGSLGGVVILLTWLYLSSFVALLGAVINAEAERQTRHDSTTPPPKPMGERGAYAADTLGDATG